MNTVITLLALIGLSVLIAVLMGRILAGPPDMRWREFDEDLHDVHVRRGPYDWRGGDDL